VLTEAIAAGGSSISDYVDAQGRKGFFQFSHRVYQRTASRASRAGRPSPRAGGGNARRTSARSARSAE